MGKKYVRGLAPVFGMLLVFSAADDVPAKPGGDQPKPFNPASVNPGKKLQKDLITPFCGRHQDESSGSMKFVRPDRRVTHIEAKYALGAIGATIPLRATLILDNNGGPVPDQMVEFKVDGQLVGEALTNNKGEVRVDYKVPNKMGPKKVIATFRGSKKCRPATDDTHVGTVRSSTTLTWSNHDYANKDSPIQLKGTLDRITDGKGVSGREVTIYINDVKVGTTLTGPSGQIKYDYTPGLGIGVGTNMKVKAQFVGDPLYNPSVANDSIPVYPKRKTAYLRWASVTGMYGQTVTAYANVTVGMQFPAGSKLSGVSVRMSRERGNRWSPPHYNPKFLGQGNSGHLGLAAVTFTIRDKPMKYSLNAYADVAKELYDLDTYNGKHGAHLTVLPATVKLTVSGPSIVHVGDSIPYQVTARRTTDNQLVEGLRVCAESSGCQKTDSSGKATVTYKVSSQQGTGSRSVKFRSDSNDFHVGSSTTLTVTAKPNVN